MPRVLEVEPRSVEMWIIQAQHLRMLGRKEERSQAAFRRAIELIPNGGRGLVGARLLLPVHDQRTMISRRWKRGLATRQMGSAERRIAQCRTWAIGGRPGATMSKRSGTSRRARSSGLKPNRSMLNTSAANARPGHRDLRRPSWLRVTSRGNPTILLIFIIGMPRSGTTLLERILSRHSKIEAAGEL